LDGHEVWLASCSRALIVRFVLLWWCRELVSIDALLFSYDALFLFVCCRSLDSSTRFPFAFQHHTPFYVSVTNGGVQRQNRTAAGEQQLQQHRKLLPNSLV
jgi:hypothetical protein